MDKIKQLEELRNEIIDKCFKENWQDVWFFPSGKWVAGAEQVKGYLGTQDIIFLCLNPSYRGSPSDYDIEFYTELKKNFENAHLTDLCKIRKVGKFEGGNENEEREQIEFLKKEIEIIDPVLIVLVGVPSFKEKFYDPALKEIGYKGEIEPVYHYTQRFPKNKNKFCNDMEEVRNKYK